MDPVFQDSQDSNLEKILEGFGAKMMGMVQQGFKEQNTLFHDMVSEKINGVCHSILTRMGQEVKS